MKERDMTNDELDKKRSDEKKQEMAYDIMTRHERNIEEFERILNVVKELAQPYLDPDNIDGVSIHPFEALQMGVQDYYEFYEELNDTSADDADKARQYLKKNNE